MTDVGYNQGETLTCTTSTTANREPHTMHMVCRPEAPATCTISWLSRLGTTHTTVYDIAGAKTTAGRPDAVARPSTLKPETSHRPPTRLSSILRSLLLTPRQPGDCGLHVRHLAAIRHNDARGDIGLDLADWHDRRDERLSGDCYGYIYTTSTSPISFSWQLRRQGLPNGGSAYDGTAMEILAGAAAPPGPETLTVTNSPVVYNGSPQAATVSASVQGSVSDVLYNGSSAVPAAIGTYAITANFTPENTATYTSLTAVSVGNFVINKATPVVTLSSSLNPSTVGKSVTFTATVPPLQQVR